MTKRHSRSGEPTHDETLDQASGLPDPAAPTSETAAETSQLPVVPEEPATDPAVAPEPATGPSGRDAPATGASGSLAGSTWVAMIIGLLILILLIIFIMQNQQQVELNLFAWGFQFPAGIGYLITAIAGGLIVALVGMVRMLELRRQVRKLRKQLR